ncbi:hypothetical protein GX441_09270 [bacterium]|nr:hypothetical protein [bacterium]
MRIVFPKSIIWYMLLFASSVVFPLSWLLINPAWGWAIISLIWGSIIILSLVPFFLYLRDRINMDVIIEFLKVEGLGFIAKKNFRRIEKNINALDIIAMGAYTDFNFEVFELAEEAMADLLIKIGEILNQLKDDSEEKKHFSKIQESINSKLRETCWDTIDNSRAPFITVLQVERIGTNAVEIKDRHTEVAARNIIIAIAARCNRDTRMRLSIQCFLALFRIMEKHPPEAMLADMIRGANTLQEHYTYDILEYIYDRHLREGWQEWLEWLFESIVEFIPRYKFELSDNISKEILKEIWLTDARFEEPNTSWLYHLLEKNGIVDEFLKEELFEKAVEKGKKFGILEDRLEARWNAFQKYNDWKHFRLGNVGPPED